MFLDKIILKWFIVSFYKHCQAYEYLAVYARNDFDE